MQQVIEVLDGMEAVIDRCTTGSVKGDGLYVSNVRAALRKAFELNRVIHSADENSNHFAVTSALRGMCEDIIALKFLSTFSKRDREEAIGMLMLRSVLQLMREQTGFFAKYRPSQPILEAKDVSAELKELSRRLRALRGTYKWARPRDWPTVREMAEKIDLISLYDFLYAATSSFVHFSPSNLMRMGVAEGPQLHFSTTNFSDYYDAFNRFYGLFLFITFCTTFAATLGCAEEMKPAVEQLMRHIDEELRWPELVTMEELNIPSVSKMLRLMAHTARKFVTAPSVWVWEERT